MVVACQHFTLVSWYQIFTTNPGNMKQKTNKKANRRLIPIIGLLLAPIVNCFADSAQTMRFTIIRHQKAIGQVITSSSQCSQGYQLILHAEMKEKFILELRIQNRVENVFGKEGLITSNIERKINGNTKISHRVKYNNGAYTCEGRGGFEGPIPMKITFTVTMLYFQEPLGQQEIYSEPYKRMVTIKNLGDGVYRIRQPDGNATDFHYRGGSLVKVIAQSSYGEVTFVRI